MQLTDPFDPDSNGNGVSDGDEAPAMEPVRLLLDDTCTVTVNGQSVQVDPNGTFAISNVTSPDLFRPGGPGTPFDNLSDDFLRATGVCNREEGPLYSQSECFRIRTGESFSLGPLTFSTEPPLSIDTISAAPDSATLTAIGGTTPIRVTAVLTSGAQIVLDPTEADIPLAQAGVCPQEGELCRQWESAVAPVLRDAGLIVSENAEPAYGGRFGRHPAALAQLLEGMQLVYNIDPTAKW